MINNIKYPFWGFIEKYKVFEISTKKEIIDRYKAAIDEYFEKNNLTLPNNKPLYEKERLPYALYLDLIDKEKCNVDLYTLNEIHKVRDAKLGGYDCTDSLEYFIQAHPELFATNEDPPTERAPTERGTLSLNYVTDLTDEQFKEYSEQNEKLVTTLTPPKENDYLLQTKDGIGLLPTKNISLVVAPPKCGKSTFVSIMIASVLGCGWKFGRYVPKKKKGCKVLHIDTEQGEPDQQKNMRYIYNMCEEKRMTEKDFSQIYRCLGARIIRGKKLKKSVEVEIINYKPDLVVIDGVAQMAEDIMNQPEAAKINDELQLMAERYECNIMCVIHTPKMKRNETDTDLFLPKGALGTMLYQGAYDIFTCVKKGEGKPDQYFVVTHIGRGKETPQLLFDRDPEKNGMPKPHYEIKIDSKLTNIINAGKQIFSDNGNKPIVKGDWIKQMSDKLGKGYSEKSIRDLLDANETEIKKEFHIEDKGNKILVKMKSPNDPEQQVFNPIADPDQPTEEAPF